MSHIPLQNIGEGPTPRGGVLTAGRLGGGPSNWWVENAHVRLALELGEGITRELEAGDLVRVRGYLERGRFVTESLEVVHGASGRATTLATQRHIPLGDAVQARALMNGQIREFFISRDFLEVETPAWVASPGTDIYLVPFAAAFEEEGGGAMPGYLHTSPEFAMKRLLVEGFECIFELCHVWRNGEVTDLHNPEFTILEWYRAWQDVEAIMEDVEALTKVVLRGSDVRGLDRPFERLTMQEVFWQACGFDLLDALDAQSLYEQVQFLDLLPPRVGARGALPRWDELFFELFVTHIDDYLKGMGAVFVTEWPTPLAVLAKKKESDPRVAERFELYVDGVELANGFGELTDPAEQRRRFAQDLAERRALGLPEMPMPEAFLEALEQGMPPSAGVAMGIDRLLMLRTGAVRIREVVPFALWRDGQTGKIRR